MDEQPDFKKAIEESLQKGMPQGLTELQSMVAYSQELFQTHVNGGFSAAQALYLVAVMISGNPGTVPQA